MSRIDMRKRQILPTLQGAEPFDQAWLDMDRNVLVEVTSEEEAYPIESALLPDENENCGWRAANPGTQIIRAIFDEPQTLRRICLVFEDTENTRTQEFVLRWSPGTGQSFREIVRQQWNFSPSGSIRESPSRALLLFNDDRVFRFALYWRRYVQTADLPIQMRLCRSLLSLDHRCNLFCTGEQGDGRNSL
jgi:hypothetical protein